MKVYLGKYGTYWSNWYLTGKIYKLIYRNKFDFLSDDEYDAKIKIEKYLDKIIPEWFWKFVNFFTNRRYTYIKIDDYDIWSLDHTLSMIILESLRKFKQSYIDSEVKGIPGPFLTDPEYENQMCFDFYQSAYNEQSDIDNWIRTLDKMIYSFDSIVNDGKSKFFDHSECTDLHENMSGDEFTDSINKIKVDKIGLEIHYQKVDEGLLLFSKYFKNLWD